MKHTDNINKEILKCLGDGLTYKEMKSVLFLSTQAIRKRIRKMRDECGAKNNTELIKKVAQVLPV